MDLLQSTDSLNNENQENMKPNRKRKHFDTLYDALGSTSIATLVKDWIDSYKLNQLDAIQELVQFIVKVSITNTVLWM